MREIIVQRWCEFCWLSDESRVTATGTWTLGLAQGEVTHPKVKVLDVCDTHGAMMQVIHAAHDLSGVVPESGRGREVPMQQSPTPAPRAISGAGVERIACQVCGETLNRTSMANHIWSQHIRRPRPEAPLVCPECGRTCDSTTSCGVHRMKSHGYDPITDALGRVPNFQIAKAIARGA